MSYLFIDRIVRLEANKQIVTTKNVTISEDVFRDHFVGCPVMPGSMLIECLAQAATALLEVSSDFKWKALPIMIEQIKFRALVRPGDQLKITVNVLSLEEPTVRLDGVIHAADKLVASARFTFTLQDAAVFYPAKMRVWASAMYDVWLRDAELIGLALRKE